MRMTAFSFASAVLFCGFLSGQTASDLNKAPLIYQGEPRHVAGVVINDLTGNPISGAKVRLYIIVPHLSIVIPNCHDCSFPPKPPQKPPQPRETLSGEDGTFRFDDIPPRMIEVVVSKDGYLTLWPIRRRANDTLGNYATVNGSIDSIVIRLAPEATVSGILRHHDGSPVTFQPDIALMHVRTWAGFPRVEYGGWPKYHGDGSYRYNGLPPGCYYLIANPFRKQVPSRSDGERIYGEVPVRYPPVSDTNPNPCFRLREGQHLVLDLTLPERELQRVTATSAPGSLVGINVEDEGGGYYNFHELYPEKKYEAWLPDGRYWLDNGRTGEIAGPIPFTVQGADLDGLHFTIEPQDSTWMKVPVEVAVLSQGVAKELSQPGPCGFVDVSLVRFDRHGYVQVGDNPFFALGQHCGVQKPVAISMAPGTYTLVVNTTWLNYYVKSIRSGEFDLSEGPLVVRPGEPPSPIKIELAEAGTIKGSVRFEGKPAKAWVYTLASQTMEGTDFRLFHPVFAKDDGTFEIQGLAPRSYLVFASDVELNLTKANLARSVFWGAHGERVNVVAGKTSEIKVTAFDPPEEP